MTMKKTHCILCRDVRGIAKTLPRARVRRTVRSHEFPGEPLTQSRDI